MTGTPPASIQRKIENGITPIFNPGYYLLSWGGENGDTFTEAVRNPGVMGVCRKEIWSDLHTGVGSYNWDVVDNWLAQLGGKQLYLMIETITFGSTSGRSVPSFIRNDPSYGTGKILGNIGNYGIYADKSLSTSYPAWWVTNLQDEWKAFISAFAARYANNTQIEGLMFWETAAREPHPDYNITSGIKTAYREFYYENLEHAADELPRQSVFMQLSWSGWYGLNRDDLVDSCMAYNAASTTGASIAFCPSDTGIWNDTDGQLGPTYSKIRDTCEESPGSTKLENPIGDDRNAEDGYSVAQAIDYWNERINGWYCFQMYNRQRTNDLRAQTAAKIESDLGTPRSLLYFDGVVVEPPVEPPGPTPSQITGISSSSANDWGTNLTISKPAGTLEGHLMVAVLGQNAASATSPYVTAPAGWTARLQYWDGTPDRAVGVFTKVATAAEAADYTFIFLTSSSYMGGVIRTYSGAHSDVIDTALVSSYEMNDTSPTNPAITTATNKALVLAIVAQSRSELTSATAPTGYTEGHYLIAGGANVLVAEKEVTSFGLETPGAWSNLDVSAFPDSVLVTMALKPAAASSTEPLAFNQVDNVTIHVGDQPKTYDVSGFITPATGDGTAITYGLDSPPTGFTIDTATGIITIDGAAAVNHQITVTAEDTTPPGASAEFTYAISEITPETILRDPEHTPFALAVNIYCAANFEVGTTYWAVRDDPWPTIEDGNSQTEVDDAIALIVAGTDPSLHSAGSAATKFDNVGLVTPLPVRSDSYYAGWVQEDGGTYSNLINGELSTSDYISEVVGSGGTGNTIDLDALAQIASGTVYVAVWDDGTVPLMAADVIAAVGAVDDDRQDITELGPITTITVTKP